MIKIRIRDTERGFSILSMTYWLFVCAFYGYLWNWLDVRGFSGSEIGILTSLITVGCIVGQLTLGSIADAKCNYNFLFILSCGCTLGAFLLAYFSHTFAVMAAAMFVIGVFKEPANSLMDGWIMKYFHGDTRVYGHIRGRTSLAYAIMTPLYGLLIDRFSYDVTPYTAALFLIPCVLVARFLPNLSEKAVRQAEDTGKNRSSLRALLRLMTPSMVLLLLTFFGMGICITPVYYYSGIVITTLGGSTTLVGIMYFLNALMEYIVIRGIKPILKIPVIPRLVIALSIDMLFTLAMMFAKSPVVYALLFMFHGAAFGIQYPARRELATLLVPEFHQSKLTGLIDMLYSGTGNLVGNLLMGTLMDVRGIPTALLLMGCVQGAILLLLSLLALFSKKKTA